MGFRTRMEIDHAVRGRMVFLRAPWHIRVQRRIRQWLFGRM